MLTKGVAERREIPHEPGEWFEVKLLSWQELEHARDTRSRRSLANIRDMGQEVYGAIQQAATRAAAEPTDRSVEDNYDRMALLTAGVVGWSYPEPVSAETLGQLDEDTAHWAMTAILGVTFMRMGEQRKNSGAPSMPS
jgi:hypothetical protein